MKPRLTAHVLHSFGDAENACLSVKPAATDQRTRCGYLDVEMRQPRWKDQTATRLAWPVLVKERAWEIVTLSVSGSKGLVTRYVGSGRSPVNKRSG
jgi:hypothetical protein